MRSILPPHGIFLTLAGKEMGFYSACDSSLQLPPLSSARSITMGVKPVNDDWRDGIVQGRLRLTHPHNIEGRS